MLSCSEKYNTPKEIRETVWKKIRDTTQANCFNSDRESSKVKFEGDLMIFYMMADEYETISFVEKIKNGYHINFKANKDYGHRGISFNFKWINKKKGISYWECIEDKSNIVLEEYSYYTIDSSKYETLSKPSCLDCFDKRKCEKLTEKELKMFDGEWKINCNKEVDLIGLNPISEFYMDFNFSKDERAKIIVDVVKNLKRENLYNLKYNFLTGITRSNTNLNWLNFSKDSIIANIYLKNKKELEFTWKGFYNTQTQKRESKYFVFSSHYKEAVLLKKCD